MIETMGSNFLKGKLLRKNYQREDLISSNSTLNRIEQIEKKCKALLDENKHMSKE